MYFDWEENQEFLEALANKLWSAANLTGELAKAFSLYHRSSSEDIYIMMENPIAEFLTT